MSSRPSIYSKTKIKTKSQSNSLNHTSRDILFNKKTNREYIRGKFIGKGGFAKCYELTCALTGKIYATKIVSKRNLRHSRQRHKLVCEVRIHQCLQHPNIVKFKTAFEDSVNVYILLELCPNKSLMELSKSRGCLTELEVSHYTRQLVLGLIYMKEQHILHRDLKLGNIFLSSEMDIKIGDFGLATVLTNGEKSMTTCGTPNYLAPEILFRKPYDYPVDVWSLGVTIYTLLIGKPPFESRTVEETYERIRTCSYSFPTDISISSTAKDILSLIFTLDPTRRPTCEQLLTHPFVALDPDNPLPSLPSWTFQYEPGLDDDGNIIPVRKPTNSNSSQSPEALLAQNSQNFQFIRSSTGSRPKFPASYLHSNIMENENNQQFISSSSFSSNTSSSLSGSLLSNLSSNLFSTRLSEKSMDGRMSHSISSVSSNQSGHTGAGAASLPQIQIQSKSFLRSSKYRFAPFHSKSKSKKSFDPSNLMSLSGSSFNQTSAPETSISSDNTGLQPIFESSSTSSTSNTDYGLFPPPNPGRALLGSLFRIRMWLDLIKRYGMGFQLSNRSFGIKFNDKTCLVALKIPGKVPGSPSSYYAQYVDNSNHRTTSYSYFYMHKYPQSLAKKANLLRASRYYFLANRTPSFEELAREMPGEEAPDSEAFIAPLPADTISAILSISSNNSTLPIDPVVSSSIIPQNVSFNNKMYHTVLVPYVRKYVIKGNCILFSLSNKTVQINYDDHTKLFCSPTVRQSWNSKENDTLISWIDSDRNMTQYWSSSLSDYSWPPNSSFLKKLHQFQSMINEEGLN